MMILTNRRDVIGAGFAILFILFILIFREDADIYDVKVNPYTYPTAILYLF